jgi:DamX protein
MTEYSEQFDLDFDPFDAGAETGHFFPGGGRQALLDQLIERCVNSSDLLLVTGSRGSGKSTLAQWLALSLDVQFVTARVQATLFMSAEQLLEALCEELGLDVEGDADADELMAQLDRYADSLQARSRTLQLLVDDAHELGEESLLAVLELIERQADPSRLGEDGIKAVLLGETLLLNTVAQLLPSGHQALALEPLDCEETAEYLAFKLDCAGFAGNLPLDEEAIEAIHSRSHGMPGEIDVLVRDQLDVVVAEREAVPELGLLERHLVPASVLFGGLILALFFTLGRDAGTDTDRVAALDPAAGRAEPDGSGQVRVDIPLSVNRSPDPTAAMSEPVAAAQSAAPGSPPAALPGKIVATGSTLASNPEKVAPTGRPVPAAQADSTPSPAGQPRVEASRPAVAVQAARPAQSPAATDPAPDVETAAGSEPPAPARTQSLLTQAPDSYTLQLLGSNSEANVRDFIDRQSDAGRLSYFESRYQEKPWYVVVYGNYPSREAAQQAIARLPTALQELQPWARNLADIQTAIRSIQ